METRWKSYTSTPQGVAAENKFRAEQRRRIEDHPHVDIPPTADDVNAYFASRHRELPQREPGMSALDRQKRIERELMDNLYIAQSESAEAGKIDEIRRLVWFVSQGLNANTSSDAAKRALRRHIEQTESERDFVRRYDPREADIVEERIAELRQMSEAIEMGNSGEDLRDAASAIEGELSSTISKITHGSPYIKRDGERELSDLRVIRDEIYLLLLFPNLAKNREGEQPRSRRRSSHIAAE